MMAVWQGRERHLTAALPQGQFRFIALDVETACGNSASICQIGIACVRTDGAIETYATYVDPQMPFAGFNTQLHGIAADHVAGAPRIGEALALLAPLLDPHILIQHSSFDQTAVRAACRHFGHAEPRWRWENSVKIARRAWPEFIGNGGHGLAHLKRQLGLRFDHHDAGEDAKAAAQVVLQAEARMAMTYDEILLQPGRRAPAPVYPVSGLIE
jgi:DNA polymerase III subunit epsilon